MSLIDKAKEISGQAADKAAEMAGDIGGDDLIANTIIRATVKKDRVNAILEEQGCNYRITGIEVENSVPPRASFSIEPVSE